MSLSVSKYKSIYFVVLAETLQSPNFFYVSLYKQLTSEFIVVLNKNTQHMDLASVKLIREIT